MRLTTTGLATTHQMLDFDKQGWQRPSVDIQYSATYNQDETSKSGHWHDSYFLDPVAILVQEHCQISILGGNHPISSTHQSIHVGSARVENMRREPQGSGKSQAEEQPHSRNAPPESRPDNTTVETFLDEDDLNPCVYHDEGSPDASDSGQSLQYTVPASKVTARDVKRTLEQQSTTGECISNDREGSSWEPAPTRQRICRDDCLDVRTPRPTHASPRQFIPDVVAMQLLREPLETI